MSWTRLAIRSAEMSARPVVRLAAGSVAVGASPTNKLSRQKCEPLVHEGLPHDRSSMKVAACAGCLHSSWPWQESPSWPLEPPHPETVGACGWYRESSSFKNVWVYDYSVSGWTTID